MSLFIDAAGTIREIDPALVAAWAEARNPKADQWTPLPARPSEAHQWDGAAWVLPPPAVPESVTARQIRLWLVSHGVSLAAVEAAIDAIPEATQRELVRVEWEYAPYVERSHPMLVPLGAQLGLTPEQIDAAFIQAAML